MVRSCRQYTSVCQRSPGVGLGWVQRAEIGCRHPLSSRRCAPRGDPGKWRTQAGRCRRRRSWSPPTRSLIAPSPTNPMPLYWPEHVIYHGTQVIFTRDGCSSVRGSPKLPLSPSEPHTLGDTTGVLGPIFRWPRTLI